MMNIDTALQQKDRGMNKPPTCAWTSDTAIRQLIRGGANMSRHEEHHQTPECQWEEALVADTNLTPDGGPTTASRQSFITGNAARLAAQEVKRTLAGLVGEALSVPADNLIPLWKKAQR